MYSPQTQDTRGSLPFHILQCRPGLKFGVETIVNDLVSLCITLEKLRQRSGHFNLTTIYGVSQQDS